jgi:hypothetical protein
MPAPPNPNGPEPCACNAPPTTLIAPRTNQHSLHQQGHPAGISVKHPKKSTLHTSTTCQPTKMKGSLASHKYNARHTLHAIERKRHNTALYSRAGRGQKLAHASSAPPLLNPPPLPPSLNIFIGDYRILPPQARLRVEPACHCSGGWSWAASALSSAEFEATADTLLPRLRLFWL